MCNSACGYTSVRRGTWSGVWCPVAVLPLVLLLLLPQAQEEGHLVSYMCQVGLHVPSGLTPLSGPTSMQHVPKAPSRTLRLVDDVTA